MDYKLLEKMKQDLKDAIQRKDYAKVMELKQILNISDEQAKYFEMGLTGYPSVDKTWMNLYPEGAWERANAIPANKTVWDVIEEKLFEYYDIPAIEYFGRIISREEFRNSCYVWARTFRAMGVNLDEVVPIYGPFVPDICAMTLGLVMIGATPYFLKLAISEEDLAIETKDSKIAVVYDGMWSNVASEFSKDRFKNVIVATVTADMPSPKKQIVSFISAIQALKSKSKIPDEKKYIWLDKAKDIADYYTGEVKVPFVPDRNIFITSSSGTSIGGVVKGTVATNESTISQLYMATASQTQFFPGDRVLNHFPPTAATSLNLLFLMALYAGETILLDPRVSAKDFYNQVVNLKPNQVLNTASAWKEFFIRVLREMQRGKKFDFSYAKGWTIGGEPATKSDYELWQEIMRISGAEQLMIHGYGLSELFAAVAAEKVDARPGTIVTKESTFKDRPIISAGIPYAGMTIGVFDKDGNELPYNHRGELRILSKSAMKEYYNKPELTAKTKIDGWIHTGDLAEIDENGFLYAYGRMNDLAYKGDKEEDNTYLFDIANVIKQQKYVNDCMVFKKPTDENENNLVAHIVWSNKMTFDEKCACIYELNQIMEQYLNNGFVLNTYFEHEHLLPYSPTTLKRDANLMNSQLNGYIQMVDGVLKTVNFVETENGKYTVQEVHNTSKFRI